MLPVCDPLLHTHIRHHSLLIVTEWALVNPTYKRFKKGAEYYSSCKFVRCSSIEIQQQGKSECECILSLQYWTDLLKWATMKARTAHAFGVRAETSTSLRLRACASGACTVSAHNHTKTHDPAWSESTEEWTFWQIRNQHKTNGWRIKGIQPINHKHTNIL